jgi:hypothetical protein
MTFQASITRATVAVVATAVFLVTAHLPCAAQGMFSSVFPLNTVETYLGPIFPKCGLSSSFRSEVGSGMAAAMLETAKLTASNGRVFQLTTASYLDESPQRLDIYANLRIWRLGLHADYWNFNIRSKHRELAKVDLSQVIVGGDIDLVQLEWLALGARLDFYLLDPSFRATLREVPNAPENGPRVDIQGNKPVTLGPYLRYVPPEILGWPVHVEAYLKLPIKGTSLTTCGAGLVFRPQIYRFDIAARLYAENTWLSFTSGARQFYSGAPPAVDLSLASQDWKLNLEWRLFGLDLAVYF